LQEGRFKSRMNEEEKNKEDLKEEEIKWIDFNS